MSEPSRPAVAIIVNSLPPYRAHVHRRIAREIPEIEIWTIATHTPVNDRWNYNASADIRPISFSDGQPASIQGSAKHALAEWRKAGRIIAWLKEHHVRAVVCLGYNDAGRLRIIRWCKRNHVPLFVWGDSNIRGDFVTGWRRFAKQLVLGRVIDACTGLFPCGELGRQFFARYGGERRPMFFFPVEPDYDLITQLPPERIEQIRQQYGLSRQRRRLIFSARMVQAKRPDLCIDAFIAIAEQRPQWDLVMVGEGILREQLAQRIPHKLRERVTWTGFVDDQSVVSALYRLSDVLVLPSDYEPWALVINEAAAAGLAIVSSDVVGASYELVRDHVNGRLFPITNLPALVEALLDVTDPAHIDNMKAASADILAQWRQRGDPIAGLRAALQHANVIN